MHPSFVLFILFVSLVWSASLKAAEKPNIVFILSDDAGFADFSHNKSEEMKTPHISKLADRGVFFKTSYVSAPVCSPSRAGLLTGRYQNRFGFVYNLRIDKADKAHHIDLGIDLDEETIADHLKALGYKTGAFGKWHVGYRGGYHPNQRGFDEFFGLVGGHRSYWPDPKKSNLNTRLERNGKPIDESEVRYVTDMLGDEACNFIRKNKDHPFFVYLSFTAVHAPMHADDTRLKKHSHIKDKNRRILAAMTEALDDNIGKVDKCLTDLKLRDNTLVIYLNDNGGATNNYSNNLPLRGHKGQLYEGGLRVPFMMAWPGKIKAGQTFNHPVISLDILPTCLAAAGGKQIPGSAKLDGVNLLDYINGKSTERPHEKFYWKFYTQGMRSGDWKYIENKDGKWLFDLAKDPNETTNLTDLFPDKTKALSKDLRTWLDSMPEPWK